MQDLTTGPVSRHLLKTTSFMLAVMVFQTLYFLIDLYWMGRLGPQAIAAVSIAGNLAFIVLALSQMLGVGTTTLVSHAVGQKDHARALLVFNQSQVLSVLAGALFLVAGMLLRPAYVNALAADAATAEQASQFLLWFIPAMALQFAMVSLGAALRGTGNFKPSMVVGVATVAVNIVLAPFLIFGWVTGVPLGIAGAGLSTFIGVVVGVLWLTLYFLRPGSYLKFDRRDWKPQGHLWASLLKIGLPAGTEFALMAVYLFIVYTVSRPFGAAAQAGFGIGLRIIQAGFLPIVALGMGVGPVAGQNFGARKADRVKAVFKDAAWMAAGWMALAAVVCLAVPHELVGFFTEDAAVIRVGEEYLRIIAWSFVASGLTFVASSMFQAMGNSVPPLITSFGRIVLVAVPLMVMSRLAGFDLTWIWYLSAVAMYLQTAANLVLLKREFDRKLAFEPVPAA